MEKRNSVFIATSLDGYIADKNGGIDWLDSTPNTENSDMGYFRFMKHIDAMVMGRNTFDTVCGFDVEWPYTVPVFVLSNSLQEIPAKYQGKAHLVKGSLSEVLSTIHKQNYHRLYIDGGITIQQFLNEDLIDEMIITTIPVLLGDGISLFSALNHEMYFELVKSEVHLNQLVQSHYTRKRPQ